MPVVHAEADYHIPLEYGDTVRLEVTPELGETSVQFTTAGHTNGGEKAFGVKETHATINIEEFETIDIPDELRDAITAR